MNDYTFTVPYKPVPAERPRVSRRGRATYTPKRTMQAESVIARCYDGPYFTGPVYVMVDYYADRQVITISPSDLGPTRVGDVDNLAKTTLDGLTKGLAWEDDRQVAQLNVAKWPAGF